MTEASDLRRERRAWGWTAFFALLPLLGWWAYGLFDLDEGFYAAVTAEMNRRGEWITPFYNGNPWYEKPILLYWVAKPFLALFGDMVGPRMPSILATLGLYWLVGAWTQRHFGPREARLAVLILASSLLVVGAGRMMLTDPLLVLCLSGAFLTFWESLVGDRRWRLASAALLGLSVLAKGPVGLVFFVLIAAWTFWREPELRPAFRGWWMTGTVLLFAVVATWYLPAYLKDGDLFVQKFLVEQNLQRFAGGDEAHQVTGFQRWIFFIPILLLGMVPWSFMIIGAWPRKGASPERRYLAAWAAIVFLFFTVSGTKLVHYILPCFPPLAILVAVDLIRRRESVRAWAYAAVGCVVMAVVANVAFLVYHGGTRALALSRPVVQVGASEADRENAHLHVDPVPGFHAEVQALAKEVRAKWPKDRPLGVYQMSRRNKDLGTGRPKIQETSHPSLLLYLDRTVIDTDDFSKFLEQPSEVWFITRYNRVGAGEQEAARAAGRRLHRVQTDADQFLYAVWKLTPSQSNRL